VLLCLACGPAHGQAPTAQRFVLATGHAGGTDAQLGEAIASLSQLRSGLRFRLLPVLSSGSGENLGLLRQGVAGFAILQTLYGRVERAGASILDPGGEPGELRSVTALWPSVEHWIIAVAGRDTGTVADLTGLRGAELAVGPRGSGPDLSSRLLLTNLGFEPASDFLIRNMPLDRGVDALVEGQVLALSIPGGAPVNGVTRALLPSGQFVLLSFTAAQARAADAGLGVWRSFVLPAGTYPGQEQELSTIAQPNFLATLSSVPEGVVYALTRSIYEHLEFLRASHKAANELSLASALEDLVEPLHPGAQRYYQEMGLTIPARLLAPAGTPPAPAPAPGPGRRQNP
jgi:TRAP transporter TAXI family solute receptor